MSKKAKIGICNQFDIPVATVPLFAIKKAKTAKDVLNKKAPATDTLIAAASVL